MNRRMLGGDHSLNSQINRQDGEEAEWQDMLTDERDNQETQYVNHQEKNIRNKMMLEALDYLKLREKDMSRRIPNQGRDRRRASGHRSDDIWLLGDR